MGIFISSPPPPPVRRYFKLCHLWALPALLHHQNEWKEAPYQTMDQQREGSKTFLARKKKNHSTRGNLSYYRSTAKLNIFLNKRLGKKQHSKKWRNFTNEKQHWNGRGFLTYHITFGFLGSLTEWHFFSVSKSAFAIVSLSLSASSDGPTTRFTTHW